MEFGIIRLLFFSGRISDNLHQTVQSCRPNLQMAVLSCRTEEWLGWVSIVKGLSQQKPMSCTAGANWKRATGAWLLRSPEMGFVWIQEKENRCLVSAVITMHKKQITLLSLEVTDIIYSQVTLPGNWIIFSRLIRLLIHSFQILKLILIMDELQNKRKRGCRVWGGTVNCRADWFFDVVLQRWVIYAENGLFLPA